MIIYILNFIFYVLYIIFSYQKLWNVWPSRREHIFHLVTNPWNLVESVVYHLFLYYLHKNICNGFAIALPIPFCLYKLYINVEPFSNQEKTDRELKEGSLTQHRNVKTRWIWKAPIAYNMEIMCTELQRKRFGGISWHTWSLRVYSREGKFLCKISQQYE